MYDELLAELRMHHCDAKEDDTQDVCEECAYDVIIADKSVPSGIASVCVCGLMHRAADAIEELSKPKWIPVAEALPEDECPVLVTYLGFHDRSPRSNMLAYIDRDLGWCWWNDDIPDGSPCIVEITHWMPLPERPKEE